MANGNGGLVGVEAVIDKAFTAGLLATEIAAETLLFVSATDRLGQLLGLTLSAGPQRVAADAVTPDALADWEADLAHKLTAARQFLADGGRTVLLASAGQVAAALDLVLAQPGGIYVAA
jgi:carbamate kinase